MSRLVAPVIARLGALLGIMAALCVLGVVLTMQPVTYLNDSSQPALAAHDRLGHDMADLQGAVDAYQRTGDPREKAAYVALADAVPLHEQELRDATGDDADVSAVAAAEIASMQAWLTQYAERQVATAGGPGTFSAPLFRRGQQLASAFGQARDRAQVALEQEAADAGSSAVLRFRLTIICALLLLGLSWILISRAHSKLLRELSEPLTRLEKVVQRMLRHDPEGRADQSTGPKEVRAIARALNDFADDQSRARAVEGRIQDELHVLDSAKDDFVSNVSHELRTPLTTISGYLELVAEEFEGQLQPRHERMLEATRRNVVRLRALIDDLLALSKAETRPTELEPADVTELVNDAVTDVRMTAARRGITVEVAAEAQPLLVVGDRAMLYRAFLNVLSNAVKFSHDRDVVQVTVRRHHTRVEVAVRDHGIGIPRDQIDRLGTRFFRASNAMTNEIAGTGLGLRIVQTIVDKHAGEVVIESAEGEGTTVYVRLRLHTEPAGRLPTVARVSGEPAPTPDEVVLRRTDEPVS